MSTKSTWDDHVVVQAVWIMSLFLSFMRFKALFRSLVIVWTCDVSCRHCSHLQAWEDQRIISSLWSPTLQNLPSKLLGRVSSTSSPYSAFQSVSPWPTAAQCPPYSHHGLNAVDEIWCLSSCLQKSSHWNPGMQKQVGQGKVSPGCSTQHSPAQFLYAVMPLQSPHRVENLTGGRKFSEGEGFHFRERKIRWKHSLPHWWPARCQLQVEVSCKARSLTSYMIIGVTVYFFTLMQPIMVGLFLSPSGDRGSHLTIQNFSEAWEALCVSAVLSGLLFNFF